MISNFNKALLKIIVILALLPLIPAVIMGVAALSPVALAIALLFGLTAFKPLWRGAKSLTGGLASLVGGVFTGIGSVFTGLFKALGWLFGLRAPSAKFMGWWERWRLLRASHTGFLVDGRKARLSERASYESLLIQGGMGRGKSSTFVMPNLLAPSQLEPSVVISDTSGEIFQQTSGYLRRRGYRIRALNLMAPGQSETYNPLAAATSRSQIAELAKILIASSSGRTAGQAAQDPFWEQSAEKLLRVLAQCLVNQPDPQCRNLANLRHLVTGFDAHVAPKGQLGAIDQFVLNATANDPQTFQEYQAFVRGNLKTIQSVLMTADVALDGVATPEMAALTATNSIDFAELRRERTALYIMVNQTQMDFYGFLLNLFYTELFASLLKDHQNPGRPVWLFLDEFGHLQIPRFEVFATTARKYKVGFALFLQSMAQLDVRYGAAKAKIIAEALATEIYLPGMALDTARELEARLGRKAKTPLMAANEIIRMDEDQALMLHSNKLPILLNTRRYYKSGTLKRRSKIKPAALATTPVGAVPLVHLQQPVPAQATP